MKESAGKTAVVTGRASGIGLAIAKRPARAQMKLALADIEEMVSVLRKHQIGS